MTPVSLLATRRAEGRSALLADEVLKGASKWMESSEDRSERNRKMTSTTGMDRVASIPAETFREELLSELNR